MSKSVIVTDTKGQLAREVGPALAAHGYGVMHVDLTNPASGCGYNPLDFVGTDADGAPATWRASSTSTPT